MSDVVNTQTGETDLRAVIRDKVAAAGTSFYWAMRLLPMARRDAMYAVYAFCREVDDIADDEKDPVVRQAALDQWRHEIDAIYAGTSKLPLGRILAEDAERFHFRREDFLAVIDGMQMDADADIQAPSLAELDLYCDRVASAVGQLSVRAFGDDSEAADRVAHHLGRALQLTNILRDIAEDAERGRLYLPREFLVEAGIASTDPAIGDPSSQSAAGLRQARGDRRAAFRGARAGDGRGCRAARCGRRARWARSITRNW